MEITETDDAITLRRQMLAVTVERQSGVILQIYSAEFPEGMVTSHTPLAGLSMLCNGEEECFSQVVAHLVASDMGPAIQVERRARGGETVLVEIRLAPDVDGVDIAFASDRIPRSDSRMAAALRTKIAFALPNTSLLHDHPYGVSAINPRGIYRRKYPTGDWMTSPQVYEEVENPFTALHLLDFDAGDRGILYLHDGSQGMQLEGDMAVPIVHNILSMYDAWDEDYFVAGLDARIRLLPHGRITNGDRWRLAQEFNRPMVARSVAEPSGSLPSQFGGAWCQGDGVAATAFYRESEAASGTGEGYAGKGMAYPYVLRLVEFNGMGTTAMIRVPGKTSMIRKATILGEVTETIPVAEEQKNGERNWTTFSLPLRPFEIATLYLDLEMGRKVYRNLDSQRRVWASGEAYEPRE